MQGDFSRMRPDQDSSPRSTNFASAVRTTRRLVALRHSLKELLSRLPSQEKAQGLLAFGKGFWMFLACGLTFRKVQNHNS